MYVLQLLPVTLLVALTFVEAGPLLDVITNTDLVAAESGYEPVHHAGYAAPHLPVPIAPVADYANGAYGHQQQGYGDQSHGHYGEFEVK